MLRIVIFFVGLLLSISAWAHSPLAMLSPEDGTTLSNQPKEINMVFKSPAKLIKLEMVREKPGKKTSFLGSLFGDDAGDAILLPDAVLMDTNISHTIPLPALIAGDYRINWRAMGEDGHVIKGDFGFTILGG